MQSMIQRGAMVHRPTSASQNSVHPQPGGYVTSFPYYSRVLWRAQSGESAPGVNNGIYTFPAGQERKAFAYAEGQEWEIAGADTAIDGRATFAETNLTKPNETIAGESLEIMGLAIQVEPAITDGTQFTQARLVAQICANVSIELSLNGGSNAFKLGTLQQIPGAGGMAGAGLDDLAAVAGSFNFAANGWPVRSNFYRLPEGLIWRPAGEVDSMLQVIFRNVRTFTLTQDLTLGEAGRTGFEHICALFKVHLIGRQLSQRSAVR